MKPVDRYTHRPYGTHALLLDLERGAFGDPAPARLRATSLAAHLRRTARIVDAVAAYSEVLVTFRHPSDCPPVLRAVDAFLRLDPGLSDARHPAPPVEHTLLVDYAAGPDLDYVAQEKGLTRARLIECHAAATYTALAVGFQPGFAYLGGLPPELHLPRRSSPRTRVPAGSVAISTDQSAVYPHESPGGWHLIGRLCDRDGAPNGLQAEISVGDRVRFASYHP